MAKTKQVFRTASPYEEEMMRAKRQQQLAEMLQQQAMTPEPEPFTYQGFRAMPSPANALARILSSYTAKKVGERAEEAQQKAKQADVAELKALRESLKPQTSYVPRQTDVGTDMFADPMAMSSKYSPMAIETRTPTAADREEMLAIAAASGSPSSQRYAQLLLELDASRAKGDSPYAKVDPLEATPESRVEFARSGFTDYSVLRKLTDPTKPLFTPDQIANLRLKQAEANVSRAGVMSNLPADMAANVPGIPSLEQLMAPLPSVTQPMSAPPMRAPNMPSGMPGSADLETGVFSPERGLQYAGEPTTASGRPTIKRVSPKAYGEMVAKQPKDRSATVSALRQIDLMQNYVNDLLQHGGTDYIFGPIQSKTMDLRGSAASARSLFDTFRQRSSVEELKKNRAEGFAPGSITEPEWPRFETSLGAINAAKNPRAMRLALENARQNLQALRNDLQKNYYDEYGQEFPLNYKSVPYKPESSLYPSLETQAENQAIFNEADRLILEMQRRRERRGK